MQPTWPSSSASPNLLQKYPDDDRVFVFDFTSAAEFEDALTAVSAVASVLNPSGGGILVLTVGTIDPSGVVPVRITNGSGGTTYLIQCELTLSDGSVLVGLGQLLVINPSIYDVAPVPPPFPSPTVPPAGITNPLSSDLIAATFRVRALSDGVSPQDAATVAQLPTTSQLIPTPPGDATKFLNGANPPAFTTPAGGGGGVTNPLGGDLAAGGHKITGLGAPSASGDAATKGSQDAGDAATLASAEAYSDGHGVTSLNTKTGAVVLVAGANVTITPGTGTLTVAASGGGGGGVANPMTADLDGGGHAITNLASVNRLPLKMVGVDSVIIGPFTNPSLTGNDNVLIGPAAGAAMTTASQSVAIGSGALMAQVAGDNNTAIGLGSMQSHISGGDNTAVGQDSMEEMTSGIENTAFGVDALNGPVVSNLNVAIGNAALAAPSLQAPAQQNTAIGNHTGVSLITGSKNTFVGDSADTSANSSNSTALGSAAITTKDNQIVLGDTAIEEVKTFSNSMVFGALAFRMGSGAPTNGSDPDGSFYFRVDGGAMTTVYQARAGAWVGIV